MNLNTQDRSAEIFLPLPSLSAWAHATAIRKKSARQKARFSF